MTTLGIRSETLYGGSDDRWLDSAEGLDTGDTVTLDAAAFPGVTDGVVRSGYPLAVVGDFAVAYDPASTTGAQNLAGFLAAPRNISNGNAVAPLLDRGRIRVAYLPVAFTAPADAGRFRFIS